MGGACSVCGEEEKRVQGIGGEIRRKESLGDQDVEGRITLR